MNLADFHDRLLGRYPQFTPERFQRTKELDSLYRRLERKPQVPETKRDAKLFLGALVCALAKADPASKDPVYIIVPKTLETWALEQIKDTVRWIFLSRKHVKDHEGFKALYSGVSRIRLAYRPQDSISNKAVSYGFDSHS